MIQTLEHLQQKNANKRIGIAKIKIHPWVTVSGSLPMLSTEENCPDMKVTKDEAESNVKQAYQFIKRWSRSKKPLISSSDCVASIS